MNLYEATLKRTKEMPFLSREAWLYLTKKPTSAAVKILPTDSPDCCVVFSESSKTPCRGWQPTAEDLMADDWMVVR